MKPLKYNEQNYIYVIVDQNDNVIKSPSTGTYLYMNKKSRDKMLVDDWFVNYCKKNNIVATGKTMLLTHYEE